MDRSERAGMKEKFCQENFDIALYDGAVKSRWFDKTGLLSWSGWVVKLEVVEHGIHNHFQGIQVKIINRDLGEVDQKLFLFSDYFPEQPYPEGMNRSDSTYSPYISASPRSFGWYCDEPEDTALLLAPMAVYIEEIVRGLDQTAR